MSNNLRTRNGMPFNFVNGLKVRGMDIESLIPGIEGIPEAGSKYQFAGNGSNKVFTLPVTPYNKDAIEVHVKQLYVHSTDYTLVGDTVTLAEAPPALVAGETYNVEIKVNLTTLNGYVDASRVSFEGENLDDILEKSKPLANYAQLRAYTGNATQIKITDPGIAGIFYYDPSDTASPDDGGVTIVQGSTIDSGGTIVSGTGKRWKRLYDDTVNVKWFGAMGNGIADDASSIQNALTYSEKLSGKTVFIPSGIYKITKTIKLGRYNILQGESRYGSVIKASTKTFIAIDFIGIAQTDGRSATVRDLCIKDADIGINNTTGTAGFYGRVENCQIVTNRIGIVHFDSYINTICGNLIQNNGCGIVMRGQSYQVNIYDNIIDNNYGGLGIYLHGSNGVIIRDNTIEGNRNVTTKKGGCGIMLIGYNQRTLIEGNWFEMNCPTIPDGALPEDQYLGTDIIIGNPVDAFTTAIIENCVPEEYRATATAASLGITGGIASRNNFHYVTKYSYVINSAMTTAKIDISGDTFVGRLGGNNQAIRILGGALGCNIDISRLSVVNTANSAINTEMNSGIKKSPVFIEGTVPAYNAVKLDGVDIYTAQLTLKEFSEMTGASLNIECLGPASGTARILNGVIRAVNGASGFSTVVGSGRGRVRANGATLFPATGEYYVAVLCSPGSMLSINNSTGPTTDTAGFFSFNLYNVTSTEVTAFTGSYFGVLVMTPAQVAAVSKLYLTKRIQILDLETTWGEMRSTVPPLNYNSPLNWNWLKGDKVYNSSPVAGGTVGWICVEDGSPGVWKTFGNIAT